MIKPELKIAAYEFAEVRKAITVIGRDNLPDDHPLIHREIDTWLALVALCGGRADWAWFEAARHGI